MNRALPSTPLRWRWILFLGLLALQAPAATDLSGQRIYKLICVGPAAAGSNAVPYQYPLWEKLLSSGYLVEYVGSQTNDTRIGKQKHECYYGKNTETIATNAIESFRKQPADIVLLQAACYPAGNENPVPAAIAAYSSIIRSARDANSNVVVLVSPMAPMADLPQYAYVTDLNRELRKLVKNLDSPAQPVTPVPGAAFDPANAWFSALAKILEPPKQTYHPKIVVYKKANGADLTLHIFNPPAKIPGPHPAIVFFFGGGWKVGTPIQFYNECAHFAEKGFVAISADYRIESVEHTTPFDSVTDGKSALRWVRAHAKELRIDPNRIVGSGASAGGHVAAATATVKGLDDPADDLNISPRPDALVLWYGVIDNGPGGYGHDRIKDRYPEISPMHNLSSHTPPTLFFLGTKDSLIPTNTAAAFKARLEQSGVRCDLHLYQDSTHVIYDYRKGDCPLRRETLATADDFLNSLGFMTAKMPHF